MNRVIRRAHRLARVVAKAMWALLDRRHPILAQVVPMRRCNLACAYCNEYDTTSQPVPLASMLAWLDKLADLGTSMITASGGEPLMHPDLDVMIARMRKRGMVASIITNGYYLSPERIRRLNAAGLDYLQISIDNVEPDEVSMKSLRLLEPKLKWLAELAEFDVNVNSVVGGGIKVPEDALAVARRARELGFTSRWESSTTAGASCARSTSGSWAYTASCKAWAAAATRGSTASSRTTWPTDGPTSGGAAPEHGISTSTRAASSTTARSSAARRASLSRSTPSRICDGSTTRRRDAPPTAR